LSFKIHFLGASQTDVGIREISISLEGLSNLKDLLKELSKKIGPKFNTHIFDPTVGTVNKTVTIIVNGRHYTTLDGLETILRNGDEISFFPPIGGG
jgi:MoaD family protein